MPYKTIDITTPENGYVVVKNRFWLCKDGDKKEAIFFNKSAQCNQDRRVPEMLRKITEEKTGWGVQVVFVGLAYRPSAFENSTILN